MPTPFHAYIHIKRNRHINMITCQKQIYQQRSKLYTDFSAVSFLCCSDKLFCIIKHT